jgi:hypothetical protein
MRSWRRRKLIGSNEEKNTLLIRRLFCPKCERIHHELPDCIVPYKRHCTDTIKKIIDSRNEVSCENKTIWRIKLWWKIILPYLKNILKSLAEKYKIVFCDPPAFKEMVRAVVNSNNWTFVDLIRTRSACMPDKQT